MERIIGVNLIGAFLCVHPRQSFHVVTTDDDGRVEQISDISTSQMWINGGYFIFRREIFDYLGEGEELVQEPFQRLIAEGKLMACRYRGFWGCMDTFKDKQTLEELYARGELEEGKGL